MIGLSQSHFLQALGWATLNSFWQMALLWSGFLVAKSVFKLTASTKYQLSVAAISIGFFWFVVTFTTYFSASKYHSLDFFFKIGETQSTLPSLLTAASVSYLLLLSIPAFRLFNNWRFTQNLRHTGLQKIDVQYKLFVKKIGSQLNIKKEVAVFISDLVKSPLTVGFFKPLILLPIASVNSLNPQQVEAILLHELSHIKRYDYIINLWLNVVHTLLYFNPFVKLFLRIAEAERENCCDQMVLQFGYDKISYASALLSLEKSANHSTVLAIGAAGKKNLLARIEKIVGIEKKPVLSFNHFAGLIAALLCVMAINSILITPKEKSNSAIAYNTLVNPFYFLGQDDENVRPEKDGIVRKSIQHTRSANVSVAPQSLKIQKQEVLLVQDNDEPGNPKIIQVAFDEVEAALSADAKAKVKETVETTKKVLATYQWSEIENSIGEVLTKEEKKEAKREYLNEIAKIDWENLERNLKVEYDNINWTKVDLELNNAVNLVKLDSIITTYESAYKELSKQITDRKCTANKPLSSLPMPDESATSIEKKKQEIKECLDALKELRNREVIKL